MVNLLFDYDGTLHDSLQIYAPAFQAAYDRLTELGCAEPRRWSADEVRQWIGLTPEDMWDRFMPDLPTEEKRASGTLIGSRMLELIQGGRARLYPDVPEVLTALKQRDFRLLLLSNCPVSYLEAHAKYFQLDRYFQGLYCGEAFGYRPKYEICRELQTWYDGPFLVIGDRRQDMEIARRNGLGGHRLPVWLRQSGGAGGGGFSGCKPERDSDRRGGVPPVRRHKLFIEDKTTNTPRTLQSSVCKVLGVCCLSLGPLL